MWSVVNNMGNHAHSMGMGSFKNQRRDFSLSVEKVPIVPGKTFSNPNFVIKHHPSVHSHDNTFIPIPIEKFSHCDSSSTNDKPQTTNSAFKNSSQSLVNTLKEHHLDTVKTPELETPHTQTNMCNKRRPKRTRRSRRRRTTGKNSNQTSTKNYINDVMDVEIDMDASLSCQDISISPKMPCNTFNLTDFIVDRPRKVSKAAMCAANENDLSREEFVAAIISIPPAICKKSCVRERQVSVSESEDSFIMFQYGSDEELESTEESDTESDETCSSDEEDEDEEEEGEDEVDFTFPAIPFKRVRFAEDSDLCHVHNMVQWSYAYQHARKGPWEEYARDRDRFTRKTADVGIVLTPILDPVHRSRVYKERFQNDTLVN